MHRLVVDTNNILFRVAAAQTKYQFQATAEENAGLALHMALMSIRSRFKALKPEQVALSFEGSQNWRKTYTKSADCISQRVYKANRTKDPSQIGFFELIRAFEQLVREHSSIICLSHPLLEGDDVIAGYAQRFSQEGDHVSILSGDKDFLQLLTHPNISLINPEDGKDRRDHKKFPVDFDPHYFMFEKCFRGDSGDNVLPAYPRVRSTRLKKAWTDAYERSNLLNETWDFVHPETGAMRELKVGDLYEENRLLMDLTAQPDHVRQAIDETITAAQTSHGKFSYFHFQKFCGKYGLKQVAEKGHDFAELFSVTGRSTAALTEPEPVQKKVGGLVF